MSVVTSPYVMIKNSLAARGCADVVPFYDLAESLRGQHPLSNGWFADPLTPAERCEIEGVHAGWDDDVSRAHYLQFIAWRRLREEWTSDGAPVSTERYFIPEVVACLRDRETFLDGGAHHGAVRLRSQGRSPASGSSPLNRMSATGRCWAIGCADWSGREILGCALAAEDGAAAFSEGYGFASKLSRSGKRKSAPERSTASTSSRDLSSCISRAASLTLCAEPANAARAAADRDGDRLP